MSHQLTAASIDAEEARIRDAYARRRHVAHDARSNPAQLFMLQGRERRVLRLLHRVGFEALDEKRILDVGCGRGSWLRDFVAWGARPENLTGIDLLADRVEEARRTCPPGVVLQRGNAAAIDLPSASFDLVLQSTMFTSILDREMRKAVASEMVRVLRSDGIILWYDYHVDNPANPDVRGVTRHEVHELFPACRIELHRVTLAPPITRRLAPHSILACLLLEKIPLLRTHYLGVIRKKLS